jgi:hypothetical protein
MLIQTWDHAAGVARDQHCTSTIQSSLLYVQEYFTDRIFCTCKRQFLGVLVLPLYTGGSIATPYTKLFLLLVVLTSQLSVADFNANFVLVFVDFHNPVEILSRMS